MRDFAIAGVLFVGALLFLGYSTVTRRTRRVKQSIATTRSQLDDELAAPDPGLAPLAASRGWTPRADVPVDPELTEYLEATLRALWQVSRDLFQDRFVEGPTFRNAYAVDAQTVIADAPMVVRGRHSQGAFTGAGVGRTGSVYIQRRAGASLPLFVDVRGRASYATAMQRATAPTGDPDFDRRFVVTSLAGTGLDASARGLIAGRGDWAFARLGSYAVGVSSAPLGPELAEQLLAAVRAL